MSDSLNEISVTFRRRTYTAQYRVDATSVLTVSHPTLGSQSMGGVHRDAGRRFAEMPLVALVGGGLLLLLALRS